MAVTGTETVRAIVTDALLDIEAATLGQTPDAETMAHGVRHLNRLMKRLQMRGFFRSLVTDVAIIAQTNAARALTPTRPFRILNVRLNNVTGIETPMIEMTKQEYDELPDKTANGTPTQWYYDRQRESALFYVWPVFASVTTEQYLVTYEREFEDIASANDTVDFPVEGYDALVLSLADRLAPTYGSDQRKITIKGDAKQAMDEFLASDIEGVVKFFGD